MTKIAVLGAGAAGAGTALELARAGCSVDVFERNERLVFGASRVNEGKIHQGFIYAKDDPELTARTMAQGALSFTENLARWIDVDSAIAKSTPFIYAVHNESMLSIDQVRAHFDACKRIFGGAQVKTGRRYIDELTPIDYRELSRDELGAMLNADAFQTAFETTEYAVDPRLVSAKLEAALRDAPGVTVIAPARVNAVEQSGAKFLVMYDDGGAQSAGPYDHVVNTTWCNRLKIDQSMGLQPPRDWSFRHKFGNRVAIPLQPDDLPSVTCILGPFGDIVNFRERGFFLSWYPVGMVGMTSEIAPPDSWNAMSRAARLDVFRRSFDHWATLCPKLKDLSFSEDVVDPVSGVIFAWGDTDIDHDDSHLHTRFEVGVQSAGGYHSVNTGKFTLAPHFALEAANRVLGRESAATV